MDNFIDEGTDNTTGWTLDATHWATAAYGTSATMRAPQSAVTWVQVAAGGK